MIHRLIFDTTSAATIADSANVGAYLRASDGTLLTHTDVGGKKALDVRVAEGINVEVDLSHVDDSVKVGDGTDFLAINADGSINITDNGGSLTVDAVNLDIRDLTHVTDSVRLGDGTSFYTSTTVGPDIGLDVNVIGGTITVSDVALANVAAVATSNPLAVDNTAEDLVASPLAARKYLFAYNHGNRIAYIGGTGVTTAAGFPIPPGAMIPMRAGPAIDIEWVAANATGSDMRTLELS